MACMAAAIRWAMHLQQLVEVLGVLGEEVAVALHEAVEVGLLAVGPLLEHLVELGHHVLHALHVLGGHVLHTIGHLVDVLLHQLLAQLVHQLLELLARLAGRELVVLEPLDLAGEIGRHEVELQVAIGDDLVGDLLAALVAGLARFVGQIVERLAFRVDDVLELLGDLVVDTAEVEVVQALLALLAQLLEHLAQTLDAFAVDVEARLQHPTQRRVDVAVVEEVVVELGHDVVRAELESALGAVPRGVRVPLSPLSTPTPSSEHHVRTVVRMSGPRRSQAPSLPASRITVLRTGRSHATQACVARARPRSPTREVPDRVVISASCHRPDEAARIWRWSARASSGA